MIYQTNPAWRNGKFCQVQDLLISILDLGIIHSDATYDVMSFRNNQGLKLDAHIDRFFSSCQHWRLPIPYSRNELISVVTQIHQQTGWPDSIIWLSITRGIPQSGNPRDLLNCTSDVICYAKPYQKFNGTNQATVCESKLAVRVPNTCIDQNHKNFVWPDLTRAQFEAIDCAFDTALVFGTTGYLSEGPGFNVAVIKDNCVYAPQTNRLPGISMLLVEELCQKNDIHFKWADLTREQVNNCDDMFLTTTVGNLVTVTNYNGRQLTVSPIQKQLIELLL
jgi:branched-chain amino acid aminotransferase